MRRGLEYPTCTTCRFSRGGVLTEPVCTVAIEKGFTHVDVVTGEVRNWPDQPMRCYKARYSGGECGVQGYLWERRIPWWERLFLKHAETKRADG